MKIKGLAILLAAVLSFPMQSMAASVPETGAEQYSSLGNIMEEDAITGEEIIPDDDEILSPEVEVLNDILSSDEVKEEFIDETEIELQAVEAVEDGDTQTFYNIWRQLQESGEFFTNMEEPVLADLMRYMGLGTLAADDYISMREVEPNDSLESADIINNNIISSIRYIIQGHINRNYYDIDTYRFTLKTKTKIGMAAKWAGEFYEMDYETDLKFGIFDANDKALAGSRAVYVGGDMASILATELPAGTYYIHVIQGRDNDNFFVGEPYLLGVDFSITPPDSRGFVTRLYEKVLNRKADPSGLNFHTSSLNTYKTTGSDAARGFVFSAEAVNRKLSNTDFIKMLYQAFMGRNADASGLAYWKKMLDNGVSREYVFKGFAESPEFTRICDGYGINRGNVILTEARDQNADLTMFIFRCYEKALGRKAENSGLNYYAQEILLKRVTPVQAAQNFIFSPEFKNKNLSNTDYVKVLYRTFMGREFDQNGLNYHLNRMKNGVSREEILSNFAHSPEFQNIMKSFGL